MKGYDSIKMDQSKSTGKSALTQTVEKIIRVENFN
jgi:hypothetical protein